jgi:hypothetical protein
MINVLLALFGLLGLPFLEAFSLSIGFGSAFLIIALQWMTHSRENYFRLIILIVASLIFDAGLGVFWGSTLFTIGIVLGGFLIMEKILPVQNHIVKYFALFVLFVVGQIILGLFSRESLFLVAFQDGTFFGGVFRTALLDLLGFFLIEIIANMFVSSSSNSIKIK